MYHTKIKNTQIHYKTKISLGVRVRLHSKGKGHYRISQMLDREVSVKAKGLGSVRYLLKEI